MIKKHVFALSLALFTAGVFFTATTNEVEAATSKKYCHTHTSNGKKHCHYAKKKSSTTIAYKKKKKSTTTVAYKKKKVYVTKVASNPVKPKRVVPAKMAGESVKPIAGHSKTIAIADNYVGYSERQHRRQLMGLFNFAFNNKVDPSRTPWCAAFANSVLKKSGRKTTGSLTAASFLGYGKKTHRPKQGDIVVLRPGSRYHVGFYVGTVTRGGVKYVAVLGGNQSNKVKVTYYKANKVIAYRAT